jgi:hypothetical protein
MRLRTGRAYRTSGYFPLFATVVFTPMLERQSTLRTPIGIQANTSAPVNYRRRTNASLGPANHLVGHLSADTPLAGGAAVEL